MKRASIYIFFLTCICTGLLSGCLGGSSRQGQLDAIRLKRLKDPPMDHVWRNSAASWYKYHQVYVPEVDTSRLLDMEWWEEIGRKEMSENDADQLAFYTQTTFRETFRDAPGNRFRVVNYPGSHTLIVQIHITEAVPDDYGLMELSYFENKLDAKLKKGSIGVEIELKDGSTNEVIARIEDSLVSRDMPLRFERSPWYGYALGSILEWAEQVTNIAHVEQYTIVPPDGTLFPVQTNT